MRETIAAIATAPAAGPIGIIRISGPKAIEIVNGIFEPSTGKPISQAPTRKLIYGNLKSRDGKTIDCCLACVMPAPNTYTGEEMAEIQCHGSYAILHEALSVIFKEGAVQAEPGEFTRRAFLNGKLDLSGAEAVHDLVTAQTAQAAQNASAQLMGAVGGKIHEIRENILSIVAHFHAVVDFPDEDIDPFLFEHAQEVLHKSTHDLYKMAESYERGRIIKDGVPCVILGKPNAGKSSLLNALAGYDRAIVTPIAGTTRDVIETEIKVGPVILRISDTAGLRETTDPVEKIGIEKAMKQAVTAALILAVFDSSDKISDEDLMVIARTHGKRAIAVINKCDLPSEIDIESIKRHFENVVTISAKSGDGIDELSKVINNICGLSSAYFDGELITNARQAAALARAAERCEEAFYAAQSGMTPDAVVMDAEGAIAVLGEITGQTVTEDVVSKIFENFCVGK